MKRANKRRGSMEQKKENKKSNNKESKQKETTQKKNKLRKSKEKKSRESGIFFEVTFLNRNKGRARNKIFFKREVENIEKCSFWIMHETMYRRNLLITRKRKTRS